MVIGSISIRRDIMAVLSKASIEDVAFQLNPNTIQQKGGAVWSEIVSPGLTNPIKQYSYGSSEEISFELYLNNSFSTYDVGSMYSNLNKFKVLKESVMFKYGIFTGRYIIKELSMTISRVDKHINPTEITAQITLAKV